MGIGTNINVAETINHVGPIAANNTTAVTLLPANPDRIAVHVHNDNSNVDLWVRMMPASETPNLITGHYIQGRSEKIVTDTSNLWLGEISVMSATASVNVYAVESVK